MSKFKIKMHDLVADEYTGFRGRVIAQVRYSTGCNQYLVLPKMAEGENKYPESNYFDENRLVLLSSEKKPAIVSVEADLDNLQEAEEEVKGGPQPTPRRK